MLETSDNTPTVTTKQVAGMIQRSERFVLDLNREKKIPSPLQVAGITALLWSRLAIEKWIAAGTPTAAEYEEQYGDRIPVDPEDLGRGQEL